MASRDFRPILVLSFFLALIAASPRMPNLRAQAGSGDGLEAGGGLASMLVKLVPAPPVPSDPLELARDGAQPVESPEQRGAVLEMLSRARAVSNVRAHNYDLKTTFTSSGNQPSDGVWTLEDTSPGANLYRWSAEGPGYSAVYLSANHLEYGNRPGGSVPLRLAQVRDAIFPEYLAIGRNASVRTKDASFEGVAVRCILILKGVAGAIIQGGRTWEEVEYCVNPQNGALVIYSPVPGLYIHYDYASAFHFHDKLIPNAFTIFQAGRSVIEAKTISVGAAPNASSDLFRTEGLKELGTGAAVGRGQTDSFLGLASDNLKPDHARIEIAVGHGVTGADGKLAELEVLASSDPDVTPRLMNHMKRFRTKASVIGAQQGATAPAHEVIIVFTFIDNAS